MEETRSYALTLQRKLISEFKQKFFEKMGYYPEVITHTTTIVHHGPYKIKRIPLEDLKDIFNSHLLPKLVENIPGAQWIKTINARCRVRDICELRYMYFRIASIMGYSWCAIARSVNMDHSSVIHGIQTLSGHVETDARVRQDYYNTLFTVKKIIEDEYRHLECAYQIQAESEPALLDTLHE